MEIRAEEISQIIRREIEGFDQKVSVTETGTVWDYGPSLVHFRNNKVIHWEESPTQPLRVAH